MCGLRLRGATAGAEGVEIPLQVLRQPCPDAEARLALSSAAPGGWELDHGAAGEKRLHGEFEIELEAGFALDGDVLQNLPIVELERVGCVVRRNATKPMQREPRTARHQSLQRRRVEQPSAAHVTAAHHYLITLSVVIQHDVNL